MSSTEQLTLILDDPTAVDVDPEKVKAWYTDDLAKSPGVTIYRGDDDEDDSDKFNEAESFINFDSCLLLETLLAAVEDPVGAIILDNAIAHLKTLMPKWMAWVLEL